MAVVLALCVGAALDGALALGRASAKHAAEHYAEMGLSQSRAALLGGIAAQVQAGVPQLEAPPPLPPTAACSSATTTCPFSISATFALAGSTASSSNADALASSVQSHPAIAEQRVAATIVQTVAGADGTPLAIRTVLATIRTLAVPPYAILEGFSDAAGARDAATAADAAGCDPTQPASCDARGLAAAQTAAPVATMDPQDTRVRALSQCIDGGSGACGGVRYVSADPSGVATSTPWFNGDAQAAAWSR